MAVSNNSIRIVEDELGTMAPIQSYFSGRGGGKGGGVINKCSGSFLGRYCSQPWAELCWCGPWVWPSISSDEAGGQLLGTSHPRAPPRQHVVPPPGPYPWERWKAVLVWEAARGGRADLLRHQGTKAFSFPATSHPVPHRTTPGAPQPVDRPPRLSLCWASSQTKPDFRPLKAVGRQARGFRHGDEL